MNDWLRRTGDSILLRGLKSTSIFSHLDDATLRELSVDAKVAIFQSNEIIVAEGDPSDKLFIIVNGIVTVKKIIEGHHDKVFAYLLPGSTFGEVGILENKPRSASVQALTEGEVIIFERDTFIRIMHTFPSVAIEMARLLGRYLTETNKRLARGDKEKKVVLVFDLFDMHAASDLGKRMAIRLHSGNEKNTIYAEYPLKGTLTRELSLPNNIGEIYKLPDGPDILLRVKPSENDRMALLTDRLLNNYDNLVIYLNRHFQENLMQVLESADQVIIVGSDNQQHWKQVTKLHKDIKSCVAGTNTRIFTVLMGHEAAASKLSPAPDFRVVFSQETTDYQLWSRSNGGSSNSSFDEVVNIFVDRLQRNNNIGIFIPTTMEVDKVIDTTPYIDKTLTFLGQRFGGATSEEAKGIWNSEDIGLVGEKLYKVHTYATSADLKKYMDEVVDYVKLVKHELKQEAMAMEVNQKLTLI